MAHTTAIASKEGFDQQMTTIMLYTDVQAQELVGQILDSLNEDGRYPLNEGDMGYYKNADGIWTAWDNSTGDCWVEDFKTRKEAIEWLGNVN